MKRLLPILLVLLHGVAHADEADQPLKITSLAEAKMLPKGTTAVALSYSKDLDLSEALKAIGQQESVKTLRLTLPNAPFSQQTMTEDLPALGLMPHLTSLTVIDSRQWKSPELFTIIGQMTGLQEVNFAFQ